jgi:hypothetical protein
VLLTPWYAPYLVGHRAAFVGETVVGHYGSWAFRRGALARIESLWVIAVRAAVDDLRRGRGDLVATSGRCRAPADRRLDPRDLADGWTQRHPSGALSDPDLSGAGAPGR